MDTKPKVARAPRCPHCRERSTPADNPAFPFCSKRCQAVDLGRWLAEDYRVPGPPSLDALDPRAGRPEDEGPWH